MTKTTYTEMVDSGIEWIGKIPKGWEVRKLKYFSNCISDGDWVESKDQVEPGENTYQLLQLKNIGVGYDTKDIDKAVTEDFFKRNNGKEISIGDILIARIPEPILRNFVFSEKHQLKYGKTISVVDTTILTVNKELSNERFISYLFNSDNVRKYGESMLNGSTRQRITKNDISNTTLPLPPLNTQQVIASYLDTKTAQIDQAISLKTQQIKMLQEKRTALINHIVTKGLDPEVELVDSGIEWIGKIPKGWEVLPFRRKCQLKQGLQIPQEVRLHEQTDNSLEYITIKSIHNPDNPKEYIENPSSGVICDVDDILFARTGATGEVITGVYGVFHNNFFKVSYDKNSIDKSYLVRYLQFEPLKKRLLLLAGTTTIPDLNHGSFLSSPLILPSNKQEQKIIVSYLDTETAQIDNTIALVQQSIDLLVEYKQSLISHVVTGKVKAG